MLVQPHQFTRGPTEVPKRVRLASNDRREDKCAPDFSQFTLPLFKALKRVSETENGRISIDPPLSTGAAPQLYRHTATNTAIDRTPVGLKLAS